MYSHHKLISSQNTVARSVIPILSLLLLIGSTAPLAHSQDEEGIFRIYQLKHIDATTGADILNTFFSSVAGLRMQSDPSQNRLFVFGSQSTLQKIEETLTAVDKPAPVNQREIAVYKLANVPASDALQSLNMILKAEPRDDLQMATDPRTNSIIVSSASAESLEFIKRQLQLVDQAVAAAEEPELQGPCEIRVTWLVESRGMEAEEQEDLRPLPKTLEKLGQRLVDRHGFQELRTLTSLATTVTPRQAGGGVASFSGESQKQGAIESQLDAGGEIEVADDDSDRFEINFHADMALPEYGSQASPTTTLLIPPSHPVAISVADTAAYRSVLVLEIEVLD